MITMNLGATLLDFDEDRGGRDALVAADRKVTFRELRHRARCGASALVGLGLGPGDSVAVWSWNRIEYVEALLGCFLAGIAVVPLNRRLHPAEVDTLLAASGSRALIHDAAPEELEALPAASALIGIPFSDAAAGWDGLLAESTPLATAAAVAGDHPAWIFYSSGTSGVPKGAVHTHASVVSGLVSAQAAGIDFRPADRLILVSPLSHGSGFMAMLALMAGACQVVYDAPGFDGERVVQTIKAQRVTGVTYLVPTQLERLVDAMASDVAPPALRIVVYGSAPSTTDVLRRTVDVLGSALIQIYGQAEAPPVLSLLDGASHVAFARDGDRRLQSVGRFAPGVEVRLAPVGEDGEDGVGEVQVRATFAAARYLGTAAPDFPVTEDGWLRTGDIGIFSDDGYLFLIDRLRDMIVSGGVNIYAAEVERVLAAHPAVREVAVIGLPDPTWGERVHAVVVPVAAAPTATELSDFIGARLARFKVPKTYEFIDDLPRNSAGKVLKRVLRETAGEG